MVCHCEIYFICSKGVSHCDTLHWNQWCFTLRYISLVSLVYHSAIHFTGHNCPIVKCVSTLLSNNQTMAEKASTLTEFVEMRISRLMNRNETIETRTISCDAKEKIFWSDDILTEGNENASEFIICWRRNEPCVTFTSHHKEMLFVSTQCDTSMKRLMRERSNFELQFSFRHVNNLLLSEMHNCRNLIFDIRIWWENLCEPERKMFHMGGTLFQSILYSCAFDWCSMIFIRQIKLKQRMIVLYLHQLSPLHKFQFTINQFFHEHQCFHS